MTNKELQNIIKQKFDNPIDINSPVELRRKQIEDNAIPPPKEALIKKEKINGNLCYWITMPKSKSDRLFFFIHGGGYTMGSAESSFSLASWIANETESNVFSINYRLAPENPFPAAIEDTIDIYNWILSKGFLPKKLCVGGISAGGGLALALLLLLKENSISYPACSILMSPWTDLSQSGDTYQSKDIFDPVIKKEYLHSWADDYLQGQKFSNPLASPLFGDLSGLPPTLIQVGKSEVMLSDSQRLFVKSKKAGSPVEIEECSEMFHGWQNYYDFLFESRQAIKNIGKFFKKNIK
ncbi:MAG: alpha/beta hydrolase [Chloroflexi bacterium]|nr:alpha/beta hydrolase [Chloroflexota bacterium]|tara:strand:+ start:916 stop:1800 length:885 start_codon:yes stop_codon:yes gene_type:complete